MRDEAGAIQDAEAAQEDEAEEEFWSNAKVLAYAASLLPQFATQRAPLGPQGTWLPFGLVRIPPPAGLAAGLADEDKRILGAAADAFFWEGPNDNQQRGKSKRQVLQSTAAVPAARMKSTASIVAGWEGLFERRRAVQPVDADPIPDPDMKAKIWNDWCNDWLAKKLSAEQRSYKRSAHTSIFSAYMSQRFGSKHFVMAMLETGTTWAPSQELLERDSHGAAEHVARHFASWVHRVVTSINAHNQHPATVAARDHSGSSYGQHGLTPHQVRERN